MKQLSLTFFVSAVTAFAFLFTLALDVETTLAQERPNILWLTCEDNNIDWVGCYGNPHADTPNIDKLASEGFQYMHCYANAPVCAPSRSTWITGMHSISTGTFQMRSRYEIPHDRIKYYPDLLKANGYYVGNDRKTDYNIGGRPDKACWDNPENVDWRALKNNQPFFQIINAKESHESKAQGDVENTTHNPSNTRLREYHPDLPDVRKNYAKYHDAVKRMDAKIGSALAKLEELGLAENTIVIHNSDHGGVLPRSKRFLFQTGIHCPLIIRIPKTYKQLWPESVPGSKIDRLVSFVDMPKTWLTLTDSKVPEYMHGTVFLGPKAEPEQEYHFAFRGRMDERLENARAICNKRFLYIRNYMPYVPWIQHLSYMWKLKATVAWKQHVQSGQATEVQSRFFSPKGWTEELYDMQNDPDNLNNLIGDPAHQKTAAELRSELRRQQVKFHDSGLIPESEMVKLAAESNLTIFDYVRDPKLYSVPDLLDAADLALEQNSANLPALKERLESPKAGIRYWAAVGFFLLNDAASVSHCLDDESHEVRAIAAWTLINSGDKDAGFQCLQELLEQSSYGSLTVLNTVDWLGGEGERLLPTVASMSYAEKSYEKRMQTTLIDKFR